MYGGERHQRGKTTVPQTIPVPSCTYLVIIYKGQKNKPETAQEQRLALWAKIQKLEIGS